MEEDLSMEPYQKPKGHTIFFFFYNERVPGTQGRQVVSGPEFVAELHWESSPDG